MLYRLWRARALDYVQDARGGLALIFALAFIPLVLAVGVSVDAARAYLTETRMMSAVDAAALAAASPELNAETEADTRQNIARIAWEYFRRNYGLDDTQSFDNVTATYTDAEGDGLSDISITTTDGLIELQIVRQDGVDVPDVVISASTEMPTTFMRVANMNHVDVFVTTEVTGSRQGLELVLVMDNTGSMRGGSRMERMVEAARGLVNRLYLDRFDTANRFDSEVTYTGDDAIETLWIGLVPYAATVNIGRNNQFQSWSEASGWTYSTHHPTPDPDAPAESAVDHMDWLADLPLVQIAGYDAWRGFAGPERNSQLLDSYYQDSVRLQHGTNDFDRPICFHDDDDDDEDGDSNEFLFETDDAGTDLTEAELCEWVDGDPRGWLGCVMYRRETASVATDDPPDTGVSDSLFTPFRWVSDSNLDQDGEDEYYDGEDDGSRSWYNSWGPSFSNGSSNPIYYGENDRQNDGRGPNLGCPPPITPMTNNYTVIMDAIDTMQPWHRGGTWSHLGMAWGWRTISPDWRTQWRLPYEYDGEQLPLGYNNEDIRKVVVVLTDGKNEWYQDDFTAHGYLSEARAIADGGFGTSQESTATDDANLRMQEICRQMRDETTDDGNEDNDRIIIYTIVLADNSQASTFQSCASEADHYFFAQNSGDLSGIFEQISDDLSALRISR
jgi:Flp pilus assembly protein TadG